MLKSLYTWLIIAVSVLTIHGAAVPTRVTLCELVKRALASNNGSGDIQQQVLRDICIDPAVQLADQEQLSLDAVRREMLQYPNLRGVGCVVRPSSSCPIVLHNSSRWAWRHDTIAVDERLGGIKESIRTQVVVEHVSGINANVWNARWAWVSLALSAISFVPNGSLAPAVQDWLMRDSPTNAGAAGYSVAWCVAAVIAGGIGLMRRPIPACGQEAVMRISTPEDALEVIRAQLLAEDTRRLQHDIDTIVAHPEPMESSAIRTLRKRHEHLSRSPYAPNQN